MLGCHAAKWSGRKSSKPLRLRAPVLGLCGLRSVRSAPGLSPFADRVSALLIDVVLRIGGVGEGVADDVERDGDDR